MKDNPTRIFFVRHGVTAQTGKILYGRTKGIDLNEEGIVQAKATAQYLSTIQLNVLISSPLERAYQTAEHIAALQNCEIDINENISDTDTGIWTGRTMEDAMKEEDWKLITTKPSSYVFEGGESFQDLFNRMDKTINEIVEKNLGENIAIVAHRDPIIILMAHYLGVHMDNFQKIPCGPASISIVNFIKGVTIVKGIGIVPSSRIVE